MSDERKQARESCPPPATPYLPVQTGRGHVIISPKCRERGERSGQLTHKKIPVTVGDKCSDRL